MSWLIAIPAWGDRCVAHAVRSALPSCKAALAHAQAEARFVVHTDRPENFFALARTTLLPLPRERYSRYYALSDCHRQAIHMAVPGEFVALINADHVVSLEAFAAAEKRLHEGKRIVMMAGMRTCAPDEPAPLNMRSRELLAWAWSHRHPTAEDAIWGTGKSTSLSSLFFADGDDVISRWFHLHPFAFVKEAGLSFNGLTIDEDLGEFWPRELVHVVEDPDEAALIERSPASFAFKSHQKPVQIRDVAYWAHCDNGYGGKRTTHFHHWLFKHRIVLRGGGRDLGDRAVCDAILSVIPHAAPAS